MSRGGASGGAESRAGIVVGAVAAIAIGFAFYPPLIFGPLLGFSCGHQLTRHEAISIEPVPAIAGAGALVSLALAGELGGLTERAAFLEQWQAGGIFHLDLAALVAYPAAWILPSCALGAAVLAAFVIWRGR